MTDVTSSVNTGSETMEDIFKKNCFRIPFYQRNYAWGKDQIEDFWNDLMDVVSGYQSNHFFGQIVTYNKDEISDLIDGQQRVTTSAILLAAINQVAKDLNSKNLSEDSKFDLKDFKKNIKKLIMYDESVPFLTLQRASKDDNSIQKYFIGLFKGLSKINTKSSQPIKNIHYVYNKFVTRIENEYLDKKSTTDKIELLQNLYDSFMDKFFVSIISTRNQEDAFVIFETLNSRGKDLSPSEIIKTHLMSQISNEDLKFKNDFNETWNKLDKRFNKKSDKLSKYIRIYWSASHRLVSSKNLYKDISKKVRGVNSAVKFKDDLNYLVDYYLAVDNPKTTIANSELIGDSITYAILNLLRKMQVRLHYPILFSMLLRKMNAEDMRKIIYKVLCVFIRHRTICMYGTNKLETGYAKIAEDIWKQKIVSPEDINEALDESILVDDIETKNSFRGLRLEKANGPKGWTLRYILFRLYQENDNDDFKNKSIDDTDLSKYEVYHIADVSEVDESYYDYVGNYILIEYGISPETFGIQEALKRSSLKTNNELYEQISNDGWNQDSIIERQNTFAEQSINIW